MTMALDFSSSRFFSVKEISKGIDWGGRMREEIDGQLCDSSRPSGILCVGAPRPRTNG